MGVSVSPVSSRISRPMLQLSANTDFYLNIKCNINIVINYIVGEATQSVLRLHIDVHKQSFLLFIVLINPNPNPNPTM